MLAFGAPSRRYPILRSDGQAEAELVVLHGQEGGCVLVVEDDAGVHVRGSSVLGPCEARGRYPSGSHPRQCVNSRTQQCPRPRLLEAYVEARTRRSIGAQLDLAEASLRRA
jgi:hypothetical protein